ncbi:MAG: NADP-dependent oxidoreductase [Pseudomonadales bacterium]|jgi:NADPH-dependent curcumin reductase CurA|nr:NADP-dependent oxidoreductase [Pseudomonadales bacterium]MEC8813419.1 NADP-dependent oxidoreductase [Pseudomonadota bacterium]HAG95912.1 NADP-dependent oxidoreductase [Gammaproteobacteria bacterium]HBO94273.1 NADP-dependent oxidoreductase [Gammaproteobacteria bacterium]HCB38098.1 NADP-dependent oxidoreductase [Gammaproteobacteria bacterium]|tara:strand:- start:657 stop:1649 length:993 start_codon:yes stop_codon:yes gene_type:complete
MHYKAIKLIKRPGLNITPDVFDVVTEETPELNEGQVLIKQTAMSLDPAMKGWMSPDTESYIPPVELGSTMRSTGVGEVVGSLNDNIPVGTRLMGMTGWAEYLVSDGRGMQVVPDSISDEAVLCVLSLPGMTAYHGLMNVGKPKAGETLFVTGAAGSVGVIVGQIAKAEGLRVVGCAGSDEKCRWLESELGFDQAINYHSDNLSAELAAAMPDGIDVFFENTGGPVQLLAYERMNTFGRIVVCGLIADYSSAQPAPGPSWLRMIKKRLTIQGFAMPDHWDKSAELVKAVSTYLMKGQIQYKAHTLQGLESAIEGVNLLFTGGNMGKLMVKL